MMPLYLNNTIYFYKKIEKIFLNTQALLSISIYTFYAGVPIDTSRKFV